MVDMVNKSNVARYEGCYKRGNDHSYPNENIVRLVKWFFPGKEGKVLDYGFGYGENLIHLLKSGYSCSGVDIASTAKNVVIRKLEKYPKYKDKYSLHILTNDDKQLMFEDNSFDYIVSNQTVYFSASETGVLKLLREFNRVLKPDGRLIITMMSRLNTFCISGTEIEPNVYKYYSKENDWTNYAYIVRDEGHARDLFSMFKIHEIGWFDNYYCGRSGHHFVVLASKHSIS